MSRFQATSATFDLKKQEIREFIMSVLASKGKDTNYVNKRMQDSIVNFFMEDYVAPLFCETQSIRQQFHKNVLKSIKENENLTSNVKIPKYSQILDAYYIELSRYHLIPEYRKLLQRIILQEESINRQNCMTLIWRKQLCILLLEHASQPSLNNVYLMWNSAYENAPLYNKKESFYRKNIKQNSLPNSSKIQLTTQMHASDLETNDTHSTIKDDTAESQLRQSNEMNQSAGICAKIEVSQRDFKYATFASSQNQSFSFEIVQSVGNQVVSLTFLSKSLVLLR